MLIRKGLSIDEIINNKPTHHGYRGMSNTRLYKTYCHMIERCHNPKNKDYKRYHERGIGVCDEWRKDIKVFFDWALNNGYNDDLTIDRINNNEGYSPDNCRWVTMAIQNSNKQNNYLLKHNDEWRTLKEIAQIENIPKSTAYKRYVISKKTKLPRKQLY